MGLETGTYISDLVSTNPTSTDAKSQGDDHIRLTKSTLLNTFPNITGAVTPTHTELNYVSGVTSAIQTQLDAKAPLASPALTGTPTAPTAANGTATTQLATCAFVANYAINPVLPGQSTHANELLTTDGTNASFSPNLKAGTIRFVDSTDTTKKLAFDISAFTTATTRTITVPDGDITLPIAATQTQMEAASSNTVMMTPGNANWHPSAAKAWIKCGVTGNILASYNVTSITDDGTGLVTVTIGTDFSGANNYAIVASVSQASGGDTFPYVIDSSIAAGSFQGAGGKTSTGVLQDPVTWAFACYGDQ